MLRHSEVARRWVQDKGQGCATGARMFYAGDTIYSFNTNWPIARWIQTPQGWTVLMRESGRSMSTRRHHGIVLRALDVTPFFVDFRIGYPPNNSEKYFKDYMERLKLAREAALRPRIWPRTRRQYLRQAVELVSEMHRFAQCFELDWRIEPDDKADTLLARYIVEGGDEK